MINNSIVKGISPKFVTMLYELIILYSIFNLFDAHLHNYRVISRWRKMKVKNKQNFGKLYLVSIVSL